jgi:hypothetical protein
MDEEKCGVVEMQRQSSPIGTLSLMQPSQAVFVLHRLLGFRDLFASKPSTCWHVPNSCPRQVSRPRCKVAICTSSVQLSDYKNAKNIEGGYFGTVCFARSKRT